jgi:hypothetical protein
MHRPGRHSFLKTLTLLGVATILVSYLAPSARAQQGAGALTGVVTDNTTGKPLDGVVVLVKSPNLQEEQITATDSSGFYRVAALPPGTYSIQFDKEGFFPNQRAGIGLRSDTTLRINSALAPAVGAAEEVVITQRPVVDVGSSGTTTTVDSEMIKRVPLSAPGSKGSASRTFESVAEVAPGANNDLYGAGVNGATSPENHYSLDGMSVGNRARARWGPRCRRSSCKR